MAYPDAKGSMRLPGLPQHWQTSTIATAFSSRTSLAGVSSGAGSPIVAKGGAFAEP